MFKSSYAQTKVTGWAASYLSDQLNARVEVGEVDIEFFRTLVLKQVYIEDQNSDTLAFIGALKAEISEIDRKIKKVSVSALSMDKAIFRLKTLENGEGTNVDFILDYFATDNADTTGFQYIINADRFELSNSRFTYDNFNFLPVDSGIDFNHLDLYNLNASIINFNSEADTLSAHLANLSVRDKSGFRLDSLSADLSLSPVHTSAKNLLIKTEFSRLSTDLNFTYERWTDYRSFISNVYMRYDKLLAELHLHDIGYFTKAFYGLKNELLIKGNFRGPVNDLKGRKIELSTATNTFFAGGFDLSGLPDIDNTFINLEIAEAKSNYTDLVFLMENNLQATVNFPTELAKLGVMRFNGSFTGFIHEFVAYGNMNTLLGGIRSDIKLKTDSLGKNTVFSGSLAAERFDLGKLIGDNNLGTLTASLEVEGHNMDKEIEANIKGEIDRIVYSEYNYKKIEVDGKLETKKFSGSFKIDDPNVALDFKGLVDFNAALPVFDFTASLYNINPVALNLLKTEKEVTFGTVLYLNATGDKLSNLSGSIRAVNTDLCIDEDIYSFDKLELSSLRSDLGNKLSFTSDFADISVIGDFYAEELPNSFLTLISDVLPSLHSNRTVEDRNLEQFDFSINFKNTKYISEIFAPELSIGPSTTIYGNFDSYNSIFGVFMRSGQISYRNMLFSDVSLDSEKVNEAVYLSGFVDRLSLSDSSDLGNLNLNIIAINDVIDTKLSWQNEVNNSAASLAAKTYFMSKERVEINLLPGNITVRDNNWEIPDSSLIVIDTSWISVNNLNLVNGAQQILLDGAVSKNIEDKLRIDIVDMELSMLNDFIESDLEPVLGRVNARATLSDFYNNMIIESFARVDSLQINSSHIGDFKVQSTYNSEFDNIDLAGHYSNGEIKELRFDGVYYPEKKEDNIDLTAYLEDFDLSVLNSFEIPDVSNFSGYANGLVNATGSFSQPVLEGQVDFDNGRFTIDYLNASYTYNDVVEIQDGLFAINYKPIYDDLGNRGDVVASVFHENFTNWNFDVYAEVNNLMVLNTSEEMNPLYYGSAYATGSVQIGGYTNKLEINVDARTDEGTSFKLPLGGTEEVTLENFVNFVSKGDSISGRQEYNLSGINMTLDIEATPDAEVQLIFDEQAGDILRGRGNGKITIEISPAGQFSIFGRYDIEEGDYLFTLQNIFSKKFEIERGGLIAWYGDPYDADIDITAVYNLRTPLAPIIIESPELYRSREQVDVVLNLSEKLMNPYISFDIRLPQATETERTQLESTVSTTQDLNKQVFALLILNRFLPHENTAAAEGGGISGIGSGTYDFVSSQISSWLSQISNDFDIGLNYRPGDQISSGEVAVALSTQLFNERLELRGNLGVTSPGEGVYGQAQTGLVGDFMVEYLITPDGKFRLRAFNETNPYEIFSTSNSLYTQGVGLVYQEDFNTLGEFLEKLGELFKNSKKEEDL